MDYPSPRLIKFNKVKALYGLSKEDLRELGINPTLRRKYDAKLIDACLDKRSGINQEVDEIKKQENDLLKRIQYGNIQGEIFSC